MKEEIGRLGNRSSPDTTLIYSKAGELMLAVLDSLYTRRREKLFQYYDVEKATVYLEFEFGEWKIKEAM
ncbi:hypothetical protein L0337_10025 [candidate division KSB1 bacterium]|nr:hypothetical protein [candidate division KSB1 bacterium]